MRTPVDSDQIISMIFHIVTYTFWTDIICDSTKVDSTGVDRPKLDWTNEFYNPLVLHTVPGAY